MIGLIVPSNIKYAPYVNYYVKKLEEEKVPYQIISWNRRGIKEEVDFTSVSYTHLESSMPEFANSLC